MDQLINLNTAYWARITTAPDGYPIYFVLWVDRMSRSMANPYPILHTTTINGYGESFYYKGYVPQEDIPRDLLIPGIIILDLEPLDHHYGIITSPNITIDADALQEFL